MRALCDAKSAESSVLNGLLRLKSFALTASALTMTNTPGLVAFEDADSAAEGRELDFGEAIANCAEQALGVF